MAQPFEWIHDYDLFLFDFDGILVNTEKLHYRAYQKMCRQRGAELEWDFPRYCQAAHYSATGLEEQIYAALPALREQEPRWEILYQEKKKAFLLLIQEGEVELMPGVEELLYELAKAQIRRCVVTHSAKILVDTIRKGHPVLNTIPTWYTRENYIHPKPHPECYEKAIRLMGEEGDRIVGFEDTPRGLKALLATQAKAVLICPSWHPGKEEAEKSGVQHFSSFLSISPKKISGGREALPTS